LLGLLLIKVSQLIALIAHQRFVDTVVKLLTDQEKKVGANGKEELYRQLSILVDITNEPDERFTFPLCSKVE